MAAPEGSWPERTFCLHLTTRSTHWSRTRIHPPGPTSSTSSVGAQGAPQTMFTAERLFRELFAARR